MKRKGDLIFWEIKDFHTTKDHLEDLGFEKFVPRNDFKSALIKVLIKLTRSNNKLYRRFNDNADFCSFGVFAEDVTATDIAISKELIVKVDKDHGNLTYSDEKHPLCEKIDVHYREAKETLDSKQLRSMVLKIIKQDCFGIAMRSGGGIYFIDQKFDALRDKLSSLFNAFPSEMKLHTVPVYADPGTEEAIQHATKEDIFGEIEGLVGDIGKRFNEGTITKRQLEGDKERIKKIVEKITVHKDNLRSAADEVTKRLETVNRTISALVGKVELGTVEPGDFMSMLEGL